MPKGYWIAHVSANDANSFSSNAYSDYIEGAAPAFREFGGKFMVRGGSFEIAEGRDLGARHVVIEFPSLEAARNCYNSEAYTHAKKHRQAVSEGTIILVEGND